MLPPPPPLFELDFSVKFPLLHLLQFLSDLKNTIQLLKRKYNNREYFNGRKRFVTSDTSLIFINFLSINNTEGL